MEVTEPNFYEDEIPVKGGNNDQIQVCLTSEWVSPASISNARPARRPLNVLGTSATSNSMSLSCTMAIWMPLCLCLEAFATDA